MKLNVFGKIVEVTRRDNQWIAYYLGNEGKTRTADDIRIPAHIAEDELADYIADLCHEWATPRYNCVTIIK